MVNLVDLQLWLKPVLKRDNHSQNGNFYECPLYLSPMRKAPTTPNHDSNTQFQRPYLVTLKLACSSSLSSLQLQRQGVALVCQANDFT